MNTIISIVGKALLGLALALLVSPGVAVAANADLAVTLSGPDFITIGQIQTYTVDISNALGPSTARGITMAMPTVPSTASAPLTIAEIRGCALLVAGGGDPTAAASYPCKISDIEDTKSGSVEIDVLWTPPAGYPKVLPATCPDTIVLSPISVSIATSTTTDPDLANNTASIVTPVAPVADLKIEATGPGTGSEGGNIAVNVTVTNSGPCAAPTVQVWDNDGASTTENTFVSATGDCVIDPNGASGPCDFGTMAPLATRTFVLTYTLGHLLPDLMQAGFPVNLNVGSDLANGESILVDPVASNDVVTVNTIVKHDVSTCSTGGTPGALGLVLLGLLPLVRRRRQG